MEWDSVLLLSLASSSLKIRQIVTIHAHYVPRTWRMGNKNTTHLEMQDTNVCNPV